MISFLQGIPIKGNYKKGKIEKGFEAEVFTYLRKHDYFAFHVQDIGLGTRLLDGVIITPFGEILLIEFKKIDGYSFNMSQFESSQIYLLELMMDRGAPAYIMIYSQKTNTHIVTTYQYLKSHQNDKGGIKLFDNAK